MSKIQNNLSVIAQSQEDFLKKCYAYPEEVALIIRKANPRCDDDFIQDCFTMIESWSKKHQPGSSRINTSIYNLSKQKFLNDHKASRKLKAREYRYKQYNTSVLNSSNDNTDSSYSQLLEVSKCINNLNLPDREIIKDYFFNKKAMTDIQLKYKLNRSRLQCVIRSSLETLKGQLNEY